MLDILVCTWLGTCICPRCCYYYVMYRYNSFTCFYMYVYFYNAIMICSLYMYCTCATEMDNLVEILLCVIFGILDIDIHGMHQISISQVKPNLNQDCIYTGYDGQWTSWETSITIDPVVMYLQTPGTKILASGSRLFGFSKYRRSPFWYNTNHSFFHLFKIEPVKIKRKNMCIWPISDHYKSFQHMKS